MQFEELKKEVLSCRRCKEKFGYDPHPIFTGKINSKIMQISQAPSQNVHITLKPFNDLSGKKLKYEWYQITDDIFYNEDNFYITSLAHCYPGKGKGKGDNAPPKICSQWLKKEIEIVNNKIYIIVGSMAAKFLFPNEKFNDLVFKNNYLNNKLAIVLPHPSPLNIKWFKDNPDFYEKRLPEVRKIIKETLN